MDIAGIWNSLRSVTPFSANSQSEPAVAPLPTDKAEPASSPISPKSQAALADILSRYDVTNITPRGFSQLLDELHQAGAIQSSDREELALVRLELDQQGIGPDDSVDLLNLLKQKMQSQQRDLERSSEKGKPIDRSLTLDATVRQLDWIQKFALLHRSADYQPLDAAA